MRLKLCWEYIDLFCITGGNVGQRKKLIKLALFGSPLKSSLSPGIHRQFAQQFGLDCEYQSIETDIDGFPESLKAFRLEGGTGCNITLPLKGSAWGLAADATSETRQAQAANTLVYKRERGWFAHNTDGLGLVKDLVGNHGNDLAGQRILILGAGGATAGILGSLQAGGPQEIVLVNRDMGRARSLVERFDSGGKISALSWEELYGQGRFELVINATSLGHSGQAPALKPKLFATNGLCYDLNYNTAGEPLRNLCEQMGQRYVDGLGMLVEQAAESFNIWTGKRADSGAVIKAFIHG